ncbi:S24 family peptidase [Aliihoeflea sp. PC F10.4]
MLSTPSDVDASSDESGNDLPTFDKERGNRLRSVVKAIGQDESVRASGKGWKSLSRYFAGHEPPVSVVVGLARAGGVTLDWLATGLGEKRGHSSAVRRLRVSNDKREDQQDAALVLLPRISVEAAAGAGAIVHSEQVDEYVAFSAEWLRARQIRPSSARILTAKGDSMEPTIRDGDMLIVETAIEQAVDNGIYCLTYNGVLLVKRLFLKRNGGLIISSDNKIAGIDEEIEPHEVPAVHIAGRVMWHGRSI